MLTIILNALVWIKQTCVSYCDKKVHTNKDAEASFTFLKNRFSIFTIAALLVDASSKPFAVPPEVMASLIKNLHSLKPGLSLPMVSRHVLTPSSVWCHMWLRWWSTQFHTCSLDPQYTDTRDIRLNHWLKIQARPEYFPSVTHVTDKVAMFWCWLLHVNFHWYPCVIFWIDQYRLLYIPGMP